MKKYLCEAIGTLVLVFFGCGAACITGTLYNMSPVVTPFAFGFAIVAMAFVIGDISGCHVNPAVSFAMFLDKRLSGKDFAGYVIAQFIGALIGSALLFYLMSCSSIVSQYGIEQFGIGANGFDSASTFGIGMAPAIVVEVILTFVFVLAVLGSTANKKTAPYAGIIIGLSLALVHIIGIPLTGTSVNPARSFGPALMSFIALGDTTVISQLWVFIVAPLVGGLFAAAFYRAFCVKKEAPKPPVAPELKPSAFSSNSKPVAKPAPKPSAKPEVKATDKPAVKADTKPAAKPAAKPASKPAAKTAAKPAAKPASKTAAKPSAKAPAKKATSTTAKKPAAKTAAKPAAKTADKK